MKYALVIILAAIVVGGAAYTYVKSGGATTPESLREANRRAG